MPQNADMSVESLTVETLGTIGAEEFDALRAQLVAGPDEDARRSGFARLRKLIEDLNAETELQPNSPEEVLGLRPFEFPETGNKGSHPDQRPCPSWCWVGRHPKHEHEIESRRPTEALHELGHGVKIRADLYPGLRRVGALGARAATLEGRLSQRGQGAPVVEVGRRAWDIEKQEVHYEAALRLTVENARELVTVLTYLADVAEGRREVIEAGGER